MSGLTSVGLFAGIGGIEEGFRRAGIETRLLCELDEDAHRVLAKNFPDVKTYRDVRSLRSLPRADILAAGFPCQDLSQAGKARGISGSNSRLVLEIFRLIRSSSSKPDWVVLENVPFMLRLRQGR